MVLTRAEGSVLSFDLYLFGAEVDEESMFYAGGREVVDELYFVGLYEAGDRFKLDNQAVFDQKISYEIADNNIVVPDLDGLLGRGRDAFSVKLNHEALFVDRLEESKPQRVVNLVRAADHFSGEFRHIL